MPLFDDNPHNKKPKLGYGSANKARKSIKLLKKQSRQKQFQSAHTLYYRAKYHKHQTKGMRNAQKVYGRFLKTLKNIKNIKGGKYMAKGTQGYVFSPPLRCKPTIKCKNMNSSQYNSTDYVCKLTTKSIADSEIKIANVMKSKVDNIDNFVIYPLSICEVDDIEKQSEEDQKILKQIPAKLGYDTLIIMKNGGKQLKDIIEDLQDSISSNRNEYVQYTKEYCKTVFDSMCNLGRFVINMNNSGYFHNDIKSDNIVYNGQYARLIDLGLSGETRKQLKYPKKTVNDLCYFMMVLTELFDVIQKKYKLRQQFSVKFKYDIEKCYESNNEYIEDINSMEKYISEI